MKHVLAIALSFGFAEARLRHPHSFPLNAFVGERTSYGNPKCPCVGLDNIPGVTEMSVNGTTLAYPADTGARCAAWSDDRDKECQGNNKAKWCADSWCYVDPCLCDLPVLPKKSTMLPEAAYQGMALYYSFSTCGAEDRWTEENSKTACINHKTADECSKSAPDCDWKDDKCLPFELQDVCEGSKPDETKWGTATCPCVGVEGVPGDIDFKTGMNESAGLIKYPADTGAVCKAWDNLRNPECSEGSTEPWCKEKWCYVDPCNCKLPGKNQPSKAGLLKGAIFQGKPAYYSYSTCGSTDKWAATHNEKSCHNQDSEEACGKLEDCSWTGEKCEGWEVVDLCDVFATQEEESKEALRKIEVPSKKGMPFKIEPASKKEGSKQGEAKQGSGVRSSAWSMGPFVALCALFLFLNIV